MARNCIVVNLDRCTGCYGCEVACKMENDIALGEYWNKVVEVGPFGDYPDITRYKVPSMCQQCEDAPCVHVCPTGASYRDPETNIVLVDREKCIGCKYCMAACPYQVRVHNAVTGAVEKCKFCHHWVYEHPETPSNTCVTACVTGCRIFGDLDDPECELSRAIVEKNAQPIMGDLTKAKIFYVR